MATQGQWWLSFLQDEKGRAYSALSCGLPCLSRPQRGLARGEENHAEGRVARQEEFRSRVSSVSCWIKLYLNASSVIWASTLPFCFSSFESGCSIICSRQHPSCPPPDLKEQTKFSFLWNPLEAYGVSKWILFKDVGEGEDDYDLERRELCLTRYPQQSLE